ncbi:hypothetical protein ES332_D08G005400v1 [Gossypium tomentosum]|uniref:Uncharacterized protein n=1 Tax=Gossypium tomentosum TaxID=34277 RepID=A0A5D2JNA6_GOSTO|nr:hypothetical protein ES332_D08G005400v1 [Gossypium tomentosum]
MDTLFQDLPGSMYGFKFDHGSVPMPSPIDSSSSSPSSGMSSDSPFPNEMLKYINQMLMEEDLEEKTCMLQDCLALQAAERSFYEVLCHNYPIPAGLNHCYPDDDCNSSKGEFNSFCTQTSLIDSLERTSLFLDLRRGTIERLGEGSISPSVDVDKVRGRKIYPREDVEEGRINKQLALSLDDSEQTEMFHDVLLCKGENEDSPKCSLIGNSAQHRQIKRSNGRRKKNEKKSEAVDLWINDQRTANEMLKLIRQHSSEFGDGTQRSAHYFANALTTRLAGMGAPLYAHLLSNRTSAADALKAYGVYVLACPFKKMSNFYANKRIMELAEKATTLHIIDFGICYGFQWPCLIQLLSAQTGGPSKLRITGSSSHNQRFNVLFKCNVIAKKWETIQLEELKITKDEVVVVNCMHRLKNLPHSVSNQSINPEFIHGVANGTYNAPFFFSRFRKALFHFSAQFDIFEATVAQDDPQRMMFEKEIHGRDIMNLVACEGTERVERPETYKQWQVRTLRTGFKQVPLNQELVKKVMDMVQSSYHRDFVVDVDGHWMLQGWKGRIIYALSCWKPVKN